MWLLAKALLSQCIGQEPRPSLQTMARQGPIPTLTVHGNYNRKGASKASGDGLATWAMKQMPTLNARDWKGPPGKGCQERGGRASSLPAYLISLGGGKLTPAFCEWFMGWPIEWTASKPLETGRFQQWLRSHGVDSPAALDGNDGAAMAS